MAYMNTNVLNKQKSMNKKHYPLDKLYYALVEGSECIICETFINHKPRYEQIITVRDYIPKQRILNDNFRIIKSLKEEIEIKKVNVCLISKDGKEKRELTIEEIMNIIKLINLLDKISFEHLDNVCITISNQVCDLLGINVNINPSSTLKLNNIDEVIVPASKAQKFKNLLFNYVKISMILDDSIIITNNDYRIIRALNGCKIKKQEIQNEFTLMGNSFGEIVLECENVVRDSKKTFRKKK